MLPTNYFDCLRRNLPELPEVETTRRGIIEHVKGKVVKQIVIRQPSLRWPISESLCPELTGQEILDVQRRGKYLLLRAETGTLLIHLGMSGSLRILAHLLTPGKHDHVDLLFPDKSCLRFTDPRRFGCFLWHKGEISEHKLLRKLGPEPLTDEFDGSYLHSLSRKRNAPIKSFIMDSHVVVGVGNIYANEALFMSGVHPKRAAGRIALPRYQILANHIKLVLSNAIDVGGTTLRDFTNSSGNPGYFKQSLKVYGRGGAACKNCCTELKEIRLGQRSTVYCPKCQN